VKGGKRISRESKCRTARDREGCSARKDFHPSLPSHFVSLRFQLVIVVLCIIRLNTQPGAGSRLSPWLRHEREREREGEKVQRKRPVAQSTSFFVSPAGGEGSGGEDDGERRESNFARNNTPRPKKQKIPILLPGCPILLRGEREAHQVKRPA